MVQATMFSSRARRGWGGGYVIAMLPLESAMLPFMSTILPFMSAMLPFMCAMLPFLYSEGDLPL